MLDIELRVRQMRFDNLPGPLHEIAVRLVGLNPRIVRHALALQGNLAVILVQAVPVGDMGVDPGLQDRHVERLGNVIVGPISSPSTIARLLALAVSSSTGIPAVTGLFLINRHISSPACQSS